MKIAIIGAGSLVFCKTLALDALATPALRGAEFALMATSHNRMDHVASFLRRVIDKNALSARVTTTLDRREALRGADFVIATLQVGGLAAFALDYEVPMRHGVDQCIGDTLGPGGIFRALHTIPVMRSLAQDMKELCPGALLLNYVNPNPMIGWALANTGVPFVGLCHGVQTTLDLIAGYAGVPKAEIDYLCAGINHMAWFLRLAHKGRDLYPALRQNFEKPEYYASEKVRGETFRQFGYFMTESTGHLSEYLPYFRKNAEVLARYCDEPGFGGETGAYLRFSQRVALKYDGVDMLKGEPLDIPERSVEYGSYIMEAVRTGRPFHFNGNVRNDGMIENLPADCCAEGPVYADATGIHRTIVGGLPAQCAALNLTNVNVQRLAVYAAEHSDPEAVVHACMLDPLTAASRLSLAQIRDMAADMLEAERAYLPGFAGKSIRPTPAISIPANIARVPVPVDPALKINARFGELGQ